MTYAGNVPEAQDRPGRGEPGDYFIAHAPADIAWLLAEVEQLRASEGVAWEIAEWSQEIEDSMAVREAEYD